MNSKLSLVTTSFITFLFVLISSITSSAQNAVLPTGGNASGNGSLSYSIGQLVFNQYNGTQHNILEGVQQAKEISGTSHVKHLSGFHSQLNIYPNPVSSFLNIEVANYNSETIEYVLCDSRGKEIMRNTLNSSQSIIPVNTIESGAYTLKFINRSNQISVFKIIKIN